MALSRLSKNIVIKYKYVFDKKYPWFGLVWFVEGSLSVITIHTLDLNCRIGYPKSVTK